MISSTFHSDSKNIHDYTLSKLRSVILDNVPSSSTTQNVTFEPLHLDNFEWRISLWPKTHVKTPTWYMAVTHVLTPAVIDSNVRSVPCPPFAITYPGYRYNKRASYCIAGSDLSLKPCLRRRPDSTHNIPKLIPGRIFPPPPRDTQPRRGREGLGRCSGLVASGMNVCELEKKKIGLH